MVVNVPEVWCVTKGFADCGFEVFSEYGGIENLVWRCVVETFYEDGLLDAVAGVGSPCEDDDLWSFGEFGKGFQRVLDDTGDATGFEMVVDDGDFQELTRVG